MDSLEYIVFKKKYNKGFSFIPDKKIFISEGPEKVKKNLFTKALTYQI